MTVCFYEVEEGFFRKEKPEVYIQKLSVWNLIPLKGLHAPRKVYTPRDLGSPAEDGW